MAEIDKESENVEQTVVLLGVSASTVKSYPHPSQSSIHALEWILEKLIKRSSRKEFKVLILHVQVPDEDGIDEVDSVYATAADFDEVHEIDRKRGLKLLKFFIDKFNENEVPCEGWVKTGDPKEIICKEVARKRPDLLVLGSRGLSRLRRIFVGGVSDFCVANASCPVLRIKRNPGEVPDDPSDD